VLKFVRNLLKDERGLGVLECQLILASLAIAITVIVVALGMDKLMSI